MTYCTKVKFDKVGAIKALLNPKRDEVRYYFCKRCSAYHLTSKTIEEYNGITNEEINMKHFLGLDISLVSTGVCILDAKGKVVHLSSIKAERIGDSICNRMSRIDPVVKSISKLIVGVPIHGVAIEAYSFASKGRLAQLAELGGLIRNILWHDPKIEVYLEPVPIQLKKFILGSHLMKKAKGKEAKTIIIREIYKKYGLDINNDDEADAFILANIALMYYNIRSNKKIKNFVYQAEVIKALSDKDERERNKSGRREAKTRNKGR